MANFVVEAFQAFMAYQRLHGAYKAQLDLAVPKTTV